MVRCPVCGNENLKRSSFDDERGLVEVNESCELCKKYSNEWAYGRQDYFLNGKDWSFTDHLFITGEDVETADKNWLEIKKELEKCKYYIKED